MSTALLYWTEENRWSTQSLRTIEEPRKDLRAYDVEFVRATYPGFKGKTFPALIVSISDHRDQLADLGVKLDAAISSASSLRGALRSLGIKADHLDKRVDEALSNIGRAVDSAPATDPEPDHLPQVVRKGKTVKKKPAKKPVADKELSAQQQATLKRHQELIKALESYTRDGTPSTPCPVALESLEVVGLSGGAVDPKRSDGTTKAPAPTSPGLSTPSVCLSPGSPAFGSGTLSPTSPASPPVPPPHTASLLPSSLIHDGRQTPPLRPTVAMKVPRSALTTQPCKEACRANAANLKAQVKDLQMKICSLETEKRQLERELVASRAAQDVENHPRGDRRQKPGCLPPALAATHHMVELDPGSGVYLYPAHLAEVKRKAGDAIPRYLLSCFYSTAQLVSACNLTGNHGKPGLDKAIVGAIIAYSLINSEGASAARVRTVLRSKVSAAVSKAKSKEE